MREIVGRGRKFLIERDPTWAPGRHQATFTIHDQHYQDQADQWQPVDESLVDDGADGFAKKCDKTQHIFRVGNGGARRWHPRRNVPTEYVDITDIQYWRTTGGGSWRKLDLPTPVWRAQGAHWDLPNLYASITNTWKRIKTDFILKDATAPTRLRFAVTLVGLTLGSDWKLRNAAQEEVGSIDPPVAWDANEQSVAATATYIGGYIEWAVTPGSASYPITVDPTLTDGYGGDVTTAKDTWLDNADNKNAGAATYLTRFFGIALIQFDCSSIPASATCNAATLHLTVGTSAAGTETTTFNALKSANAGWIEGTGNNGAVQTGEPDWSHKVHNTVAWAGSGGASTSGTDYEATALGTLAYNSEAAGIELDSTWSPTQVAGWFGASNTNYGVKTSWPGLDVRYASSDHATTGYRPKLVVDYTEASSFIPYPLASRGARGGHLVVNGGLA